MTALYRRKCCTALCAILLLPAVAFPQRRYTLSAITDSANSYLPALMAKQQLAMAADSRIKETRHGFLPSFRFSEQVNTGTDNSLAGSYFTFGITPSTSAGVRADNNTQLASGNLGILYGEYELYNFGLNGAKLGYARSLAGMQHADAARTRYLLDADIARLYLEMARNTAQLKADQQNIGRYKKIYSVIGALVGSGLYPGADSAMALAELSRARINYNTTLDRLLQVREQLSFLSGIAAEQLEVDSLSPDLMRDALTIPLLQADSNNPVIDYYKQQVAAYEANDRLINRSYLPKIMAVTALWARGSSIQYNDQFKDLSTGLNYQRYNYALGVALTYNLFNQLYKSDRKQINLYQWNAAKYELQQQLLSYNSASVRANRSVQLATDNLKEIPVQLRAAEATYAQKAAQYKAGLISLIDLTNASFVLYRSQTDYIDALIRLYMAELDKSIATGQLQSFIQSIKF